MKRKNNQWISPFEPLTKKLKKSTFILHLRNNKSKYEENIFAMSQKLKRIKFKPTIENKETQFSTENDIESLFKKFKNVSFENIETDKKHKSKNDKSNQTNQNNQNNKTLNSIPGSSTDPMFSFSNNVNPYYIDFY